MLHIGVVALGVGDVERAATFWCRALSYEMRTDGLGGWSTVLTPPAGGAGTRIALQHSETPPPAHPRQHLDLHVADARRTGRPRRSGSWPSGLNASIGTGIPTNPDFVVLADPDGNRFCIVDLSHDQRLIPQRGLLQWSETASIRRPRAFQARALPTELSDRGPDGI